MAAQTPKIENRKARFNYHVDESYEVGIVLTGTEVKSIRQGKVNIGESYVAITDDFELILHNSHIEEYTEGNRFNHSPTRNRKLLAHKAEIIKMHKATEVKGMTLVPLKLYFKKGKVKLEIGVCRGKDSRDKRQTIKERESKKQMSQAMKAALR